MLETLGHRGPDGDGRFVSDDRRFQAGFRRLAIIDLETGQQPLIDRHHNNVLLGNGEVYNFQDLRDQFATYDYATAGDMEPILPLFARTGEGFVDHLVGMYALALYDGDAHRLYLVRDRFGIKPLYWARTADGGIVFASEIKALFASGLITPEVDDARVGEYLRRGYVLAPHTLYRGVQKVPPGHLLAFDQSGGIRETCYYRMGPGTPFDGDDGDTAEYLTDLLEQSVRLQLRSDVPLGVLLSGGIDSGLIAALAARNLDRPLKAFTVRFDGADVDETPLARATAERLGADHTVLDVGAAQAEQLLPRLAWFSDEPLFDAALLPNQLICEALASQVRVVLNGTGGDELFAGYGRYFPRPVERRYLMLPSFARRRIVEPLVGHVDPMTAWRLARAEKRQSSPAVYLTDHTTQFPPPMLRLIGHDMVESAPEEPPSWVGNGNATDTDLLAIDMGTYLPEDLLNILDRTTMASSVEGRVPFLDHRLADAALAVRPGRRASPENPKALEREMAKPFLPSSVLNAPKQGFASPVPAWFTGTMLDHTRRILTGKNAIDRGWWTAGGIERLCAEPSRHAFRLYSLLMLELTVRIHVDGAQFQPPQGGLGEFADAA